MSIKPIAICISHIFRERHNDSYIESWEDWLKDNSISFEYLDPYQSDIIEKLDNYSAILWHYSNFENADLMEAQNILDIAANKGVRVFPNHTTGWHFDDKIAESYALSSVNAPIPGYWTFYDLDECLRWLKDEAKYPIVAKLRRGSGSNNVKLINSYSQGKKYAKRMFSRGYLPTQSLVYKTFSKVQSTHDWNTFVNRVKKIPNFLIARKYGKVIPIEKGYCYFQEFIENDGFDIKVVVCGDKLSFLNRKTRVGDFRASGGGDIAYSKELITKELIYSAFKAADDLQMQQVGFDYVKDKFSGKEKIIEMCFGFDADAIYECGGWFDRSAVWHNEPLNVQTEMISNLLGDYKIIT